jgi:hypothetical protein
MAPSVRSPSSERAGHRPRCVQRPRRRSLRLPGGVGSTSLIGQTRPTRLELLVGLIPIHCVSQKYQPHRNPGNTLRRQTVVNFHDEFVALLFRADEGHGRTPFYVFATLRLGRSMYGRGSAELLTSHQPSDATANDF